MIFVSDQPSFFFIFYAILKILLPPVKQKTLYFNFIMTFSPGQNGKGFEKIKQIGKLKKNGFSNRKLPSRDKTRPAFTKERLIVQPNALRKALRKTLQKEHLTHHQVPRSPQKRARIEAAEEVVETFTQIDAAEEAVLPHIDVSPADAEQAAEELHTPHYVPPMFLQLP